MLITAAAALDRLVQLTAPGRPVEPVIAALDEVVANVSAQLPALRQASAGADLVSGVERIAGSAGTLRDSLAELASADGMTAFDPDFANDDPDWDAWFARSAAIVRDAAAHLQPISR